ncbi:MAG: HNH endonuclease signature motif containing protein [Methanobacteriaceae archaeon]|nr:HNH endonuclease signature motif containing protein [Methanobacteriaceae archaeon]
MSSNRNYSQLTIKKLFGFAGGRCSMCRTKITLNATKKDEAAQIGEIAHIIGSSEDGPRGDGNYPKDKLDDYENLILLCPTCHKKVDKQSNSYLPSKLHEIKSNHEKWVDEQLEVSNLEISSKELDIIIRNISSGDYNPSFSFEEFEHIDVSDKINKNDFSSQVKRLLDIGLMKTYEVKSFVTEMDKVDKKFINTLKSFFKDKYLELKEKHDDNDEIFLELWEYIQNDSYSFSENAAALSVLCYMFELCEVFEK